MTRFAFFGPSENHDIPAGGFCMSVFALVRNRGKVLVIRPAASDRWKEDWTPNWRIYEPAQLEAELKSWRLPSTYVKEGEGPVEALDRIMVDQLGVRRYKAGRFTVENFYDESRRYPGRMHWDYCFVFPVSLKEEVKAQPWLAGWSYATPTELMGKLGSAQEALLVRLEGQRRAPGR